MTTPLKDQVRDAGYEALFLLGGFLAVSVHPTQRNLEQVLDWINETRTRKQHLRRLEHQGLVKSSVSGDRWVPRLTELGYAIFAGGRHPEASWNRSWDGRWRLLTFDLPSGEHPTRMRFRRWLDSNHFGRLQGSVWISPDPVPAVEDVINSDQIDSTMVMVFEGGLAGKKSPQEVAAMAWNFENINAAYRHYIDSATRFSKLLQGKDPSPTQIRDILNKDRKLWWKTMRRDPLLPKSLHPTGYEGPRAWQTRGKLLKQLRKTFDPAITD